MGQLNLPILNRTGYNMYWGSIWDNCYSYSKEFNKNLFIKNILILLLNDRLLYRSFFLSKKFNKFFSKKNINFSNFIINDLSEFSDIARRTIPCFYSRVWYMKYQSWTLISLFIYSTKIQRQKFLNKKIEKKFKLHFSYYNYLYFLKNDFNTRYSIFSDNIDNFY
jgi:hypothetical protein